MANEWNRQFSRRGKIQFPRNTQMFSIISHHSKTTLKIHLTLVRKQECLSGCGVPLYNVRERVTMECPLKTKTKMTYASALLLLEIDLKESKTDYTRGKCSFTLKHF